MVLACLSASVYGSLILRMYNSSLRLRTVCTGATKHLRGREGTACQECAGGRTRGNVKGHVVLPRHGLQSLVRASRHSARTQETTARDPSLTPR